MSEARTTEILHNKLNKVIGSHGNLWDNEEVALDGESVIVDLGSNPHTSITVNAYEDEANETPANVTIEFLASADGEHWTFCAQITENLTQGGTSEAHIYPTMGTRYIRLRRADDSGNPLYITASVQAKP